MITTIVDGDFYKGNYNEQELYLQRPKTTTGELEAATEINDLFYWLSATKGGDELDAAVKVEAQQRSGNPGHWWAPFLPASFDPILFPPGNLTLYSSARLWLVARDADGVINVSVPRRAKLDREL